MPTLEEQTEAKNAMQLQFVERYMSELGFPCQLFDKSPQVPITSLIVGLPKDHKERDRLVNFMFIPTKADEMENTSLLQMFTPLPFTHNENLRDELVQALGYVNLVTPIGHFSLKEDGEICYRYTYATSSFNKIDRDIIVETTMLYTLMLESFTGKIEEVATGQISAEQLAQELDAKGVGS